MEPETIIHECARRGISLAIDGDAIRCDGPEGSLTVRLLEALVTHKTSVLARLRSDLDTATVPDVPGSRRNVPDNLFSKKDNINISAYKFGDLKQAIFAGLSEPVTSQVPEVPEVPDKDRRFSIGLLPSMGCGESGETLNNLCSRPLYPENFLGLWDFPPSICEARDCVEPEIGKSQEMSGTTPGKTLDSSKSGVFDWPSLAAMRWGDADASPGIVVDRPTPAAPVAAPKLLEAHPDTAGEPASDPRPPSPSPRQEPPRPPAAAESARRDWTAPDAAAWIFDDSLTVSLADVRAAVEAGLEMAALPRSKQPRSKRSTSVTQ